MADKTVAWGNPGGAYDYGSLTAWEAGEQGVLTEIEQAVVYAAGGQFDESVLVDGSTTDATKYMLIRPVEADRQNGIRFNPSAAFMADTTAYAGISLDLRDDYARVQDFQFRLDANGNNCAYMTANTGSRMERCIAYAPNALAGTNYAFRTDDSNVAGYFNLLAYGIGFDRVYSVSQPTLWYNCNAYGGVTGFIRIGAGGDPTLKNCIALNCGTDYSGAFAAASTNNMDEDGSAPGGASQTSNGATEFVNVTPGSENFQLKAGATAIGNGADLSGEGFFTDDILGNTRVAPWDIGCNEFQAAAPNCCSRAWKRGFHHFTSIRVGI